jgi:membrane associated rhomboid family serine protease
MQASRFITRWLAVTLGASIVSVLTGGWLASWAALDASAIWRGQLWRLVTWPLIEAGPMSLVLTCVSIYRYGGDLAVRWGDRRLRRFMVELLVGAGGVTCLLAAALHADYHRIGGWATADALVIAWARQFPGQTLLVQGVLALRGRDIVAITCGITVVFALYFGPFHLAPELFACGAAALYPRSWLRRS